MEDQGSVRDLSHSQTAEQDRDVRQVTPIFNNDVHIYVRNK